MDFKCMGEKLSNKTVHSIVSYWRKSAEHDYETMQILFRTKRYSDCLFFGHIVLEKLLKAHVVKHTKNQAPPIHDLVRLARYAELYFSEQELDFLDQINTFNIRARYPEYRLHFYKMCTKRYTEKYRAPIVVMYKKLCQELTQKK